MKSLLGLAGLVLFLAVSVSAETREQGYFDAAFSSFTGRPALVGTWSIVERDGALVVELGDDFRARKAPDLKVFLSPKSADAITGGNATEGSLNLGLLPSLKGAQRLAIPSGTDLSKYRAIIVHCEQYSKLWGTSALAPR